MKHLFPNLLEISRASLLANVIDVGEGKKLLAAGGHQFRSFWTRDFCFSASALLKLGEHEVVRHHLEQLFFAIRQDGLMPRSLDRYSTVKRVFWGSIGRSLADPTLPLQAEYTGEHQTIARDSNPLVLIVAMQYTARHGDRSWWRKHQTVLQQIYNFFVSRMNDNGLIVQGPFEDWQDSVRREGTTFYLNLLHWRVLQLNEELGLGLQVPHSTARMRAQLVDHFFDERVGLFRSIESQPFFSLDGQLLAIKWRLLGSPTSKNSRWLYRQLKLHELWSGPLGPGFCTWPSYPRAEISWTTRTVGLTEYHGRMYWSWLMGLGAEIAGTMNDVAQAKAILNRLEQMAIRDKAICEIFDAKSQRPFRSWLYTSETPFSWGASAIIDGLNRF